LHHADALDHGLAEPVQQGRHEQHRAAEPPGDLGRQHRAGQVGRVDDERPLGLVELDHRADRLGQFDGAPDVLDRRDVPQHCVAVAGEQRRGDHLQSPRSSRPARKPSQCSGAPPRTR